MAEKIDYDFDVKQIDHHEFYKLFLSGPKDQEEMKKAAIWSNYIEVLRLIDEKPAWARRYKSKKNPTKVYAVLHSFRGDTRTGFMMYVDIRRDKKASIFNELLKITPAHIVDQIETVYMTDAKSLAMMYAN